MGRRVWEVLSLVSVQLKRKHSLLHFCSLLSDLPSLEQFLLMLTIGAFEAVAAKLLERSFFKFYGHMKPPSQLR